MEHTVKILAIEKLTHNVNAYLFEKPDGYKFEPGQAADVSINKEKWRDEKRPFTFTSLNGWTYLQFTIKSYTDHEGVTNQLLGVKVGDELIISDAWGAISYKGEGYFIAGGAGITPFIAILRQLDKEDKTGDNKLFFSNKTENDIILKTELDKILGKNVHYLITHTDDGEKSQRIDKAYLQAEISDFSKPFYICGPDAMVKEISEILTSLGAKPDAVIFEK